MKLNALTWGVPFILGVILSALAIGMLPASAPKDLEPLSLSPVMDRLNDYSCRKAETKRIILGGVEDGFSPLGDEQYTAKELFEFHQNRTGSSGGISLGRNYDESGSDKIFLDSFRLPENIAHGVFVMKMRQLGSMNNDHVSLGALGEMGANAHRAFFGYADPSKAKGLTLEGEILSGAFGDIKFPERYREDGSNLTQHYSDLLDFIRSSGQPVDIVVTDDTMVDVIGFAACIEPEPGSGTTFLVRPIDENLVMAQCNTFDRKNHCERYSGDTQCNTSLAMACFADKQTALPPSLKGHPKNFNWSWSGGQVKFTVPVSASRFQSQAEAHAYCAESFGPNYRVANIHDGAQSIGFVAEGKSGDVTQAWVDSNLEPYGNCWSMTPDYDATIEEASLPHSSQKKANK